MQPLTDYLANPLITFDYEGGADSGDSGDGGDPDPVRP